MKIRRKDIFITVAIGFVSYVIGKSLLALRNGHFSVDELGKIAVGSLLPVLAFSLGVLLILYLKRRNN